jgi:1,4-alpha-glucan branching enzyme
MVSFAQSINLFSHWDKQLLLDNGKKLLAYSKGDAVFAYNFHPTESFTNCIIPVTEEGIYTVIMSTDDFNVGGYGRIYHQSYETVLDATGKPYIQLYLPSRTAVVLSKK